MQPNTNPNPQPVQPAPSPVGPVTQPVLQTVPSEPQPTPSITPALQPQMQPQPSVTPPASGMTTNAGEAIVQKWQSRKRLAAIAAVFSLVVFIVGLLFGFAAMVGVALGSYAGYVGMMTKSKGLLITGYTGAFLNTGIFLLATFAG